MSNDFSNPERIVYEAMMREAERNDDESLPSIEDKVNEILASQRRTEQLVTEFIAGLAPMLDAFQTGGIMGLMGAMKR